MDAIITEIRKRKFYETRDKGIKWKIILKKRKKSLKFGQYNHCENELDSIE